MNPVLDSADVVVIGAGISGITAAYELSKRGYDVVVVEQRFPGYGASSRSSGSIWLQTRRSGTELELARAGKQTYSRYIEELGNTFDYREHGGLFFFETEDQGALLEAYAANRSANGLQMSVLSQSEARAAYPLIPETAIGAIFCADDAQVDATRFVNAVAGAATRQGVRVYENTSVISTIRQRDAVVGVRTSRGDISSPGVVWATGAWAVNLSTEGLEIPISTARQGLILSQQTKPLPAPIMRGPRGLWAAGALSDLESFDMSVFETSISLENEARGIEYDDTLMQNSQGAMFIGSSIDQPGALNPHIGIAPTHAMLGAALDRYPEHAALGIVGLWAGITSWTKDALPIIDRVDGVYLNIGHSQGITTGPIGGEILASIVAGEDHEFAQKLEFSRFS